MAPIRFLETAQSVTIRMCVFMYTYYRYGDDHLHVQVIEIVDSTRIRSHDEPSTLPMG
jgi:hypothetical protein